MLRTAHTYTFFYVRGTFLHEKTFPSHRSQDENLMEVLALHLIIRLITGLLKLPSWVGWSTTSLRRVFVQLMLLHSASHFS